MPEVFPLGAEAEAREEHLHLLGGGVLRLVEDDEGVVERPAAHERERRHLDRPALDEIAGAVDVHQVMERVVEGPQVRRDLLGQIAGEEAQLLARLHGGPAQHDALHLALDQRRHRHGHGEIGLAGARRADAEDDVVLADGVDIRLLREALGRHRAVAVGDEDGVEEDLAQLRVRIGQHHLARLLHVLEAQRKLALDEVLQLGDQVLGQGDFLWRA
jgi:hypothetical protein